MTAESTSVAALKATPVHGTLQRVVLWFRVLAFVWMSALVTATLLTDSGASRPWVIAAESTAVFLTIAAWALGRAGKLDRWWWVLFDGAATFFIVMSPGLAESANLYYGGMGVSWLLLVVWAFPGILPGAVAIATVIAAQLAGNVLGVRGIDPTDMVGDVAVWIISGIVYGWALWALRKTDVGRQEAESQLTEEQTHRRVAEARLAIAEDIHDSVLQSLKYIGDNCSDPEVAGIADRQGMELRRYLSEISAEHTGGLEVLLRRAAWGVEDRHDITVGLVCVHDVPWSEAIEGLVAAAREAMNNAAQHSGDESVSVYCEVEDGAITVFVRDGGSGFDPEALRPTHRGVDRSIIGRMERHGGTARLTTAPGAGTEWELTLPLEA